MVIENIVIEYSGNRVLESSTIRVLDFGVTALLGRNGTGKSSVFKSIYGNYKHRDLIMSFNGLVIRKPFLQAGLLNYISQSRCHPQSLDLSRLCNFYSVDEDYFISTYGLFGDTKSLPLGQLSYGMSRLLVILMALESPVSYTILDEPFSSIMPVHTEMVIETINRVKKHKGILVSDHQYRTVLSICDKLYLIVDKSIRILSDKEELINFGYVPSGTKL